MCDAVVIKTPPLYGFTGERVWDVSNVTKLKHTQRCLLYDVFAHALSVTHLFAFLFVKLYSYFQLYTIQNV